MNYGKTGRLKRLEGLAKDRGLGHTPLANSPGWHEFRKIVKKNICTECRKGIDAGVKALARPYVTKLWEAPTPKEFSAVKGMVPAAEDAMTTDENIEANYLFSVITKVLCDDCREPLFDAVGEIA